MVYFLDNQDVRIAAEVTSGIPWWGDPQVDGDVYVLHLRYVSVHDLHRALWCCDKLGIVVAKPSLNPSGKVFDITMYGRRMDIDRWENHASLSASAQYEPKWWVRLFYKLLLLGYGFSIDLRAKVR